MLHFEDVKMLQQNLKELLASLTLRIGKKLDDPETRVLVEKLIGINTDLLGKLSKESAQDLDLVKSYIRSHRILYSEKVDLKGNSLTLRDIEYLFRKRCGNLGIENSLLPLDLQPSLLSASDKGWSGIDEIKVKLEFSGSVPIGLTKSDVQAAARSALRSWHDANIGVGIVETEVEPLVTIRFVFRSFEDHAPIGDQWIAHGDFPKPNTIYVQEPPLPICLFLDEFWGVDGSFGKYDVETAVLHELGHCLGLHHRGSGTIMTPYVSQAPQRMIDAETLHAAKKLYP